VIAFRSVLRFQSYGHSSHGVQLARMPKGSSQDRGGAERASINPDGRSISGAPAGRRVVRWLLPRTFSVDRSQISRELGPCYENIPLERLPRQQVSSLSVVAASGSPADRATLPHEDKDIAIVCSVCAPFNARNDSPFPKHASGSRGTAAEQPWAGYRGNEGPVAIRDVGLVPAELFIRSRPGA
jgi:hypothetical protein